MKNLICFALISLVAVASLRAQGTAFTYQGFLTETGAPANGVYDFEFRVFDAASGGAQQGGTASMGDLGVTNGLFTATLDFGAGVFTGAARWLEMAVRPGASIGSFTNLDPRQPVTAVPYAMLAGSLSGALPNAQLSGTYTSPVTISNTGNLLVGSHAGNGSGLTNLNANSLASGLVPNARLAALVARTNQVWLLGGNVGTAPTSNFLGSVDNQPIEFRVGNARVLRLEPVAGGAPNFVAGSSNNAVGPGSMGGAIGGGEGNFVGSNSIYVSIGGGRSNVIATNSTHSLIAGGFANAVFGSNNVIGGGFSNSVTDAGINVGSTISGGSRNIINAASGFIGSGYKNQILANSGVIVGGYDNFIGSNAVEAVIGGGCNNKVYATHSASVIVGGWINEIGKGISNQLSQYGFIGGGRFNTIGQGVYAFIGGGDTNRVTGHYSVLVGGRANTITNIYSTLLGGEANTVAGSYSVMGGGNANVIQSGASYSSLLGGQGNIVGTNALYSAIGGGELNSALGSYATVPGGELNAAAGNWSFASGYRAKAQHDGAWVWADAQDIDFASTGSNQFLIRATGNVGINKANPATALDVNGTVTATSFAGDGAGLTGITFANGASNYIQNQSVSNQPASFRITGNGILNGGALGIGTAAPTSPLHVVTSVGVDCNLRLVSGGSWNLVLNQSPSSVFSITNGGQGRFFMPPSGDVGLGATNPLSRLHVQTKSLSLTAGALEGDEVIVEGQDAVIGLYSENQGAYASAIALKEIDGGGAIVDNWGIVRKTSGAGSEFLITYGPSDNYAVNPPMMVALTNGNVGIGVASPTTRLDVDGTVKASAFVGSGSSLTDVAVLSSNQVFTGRPAFNGGASGSTSPFTVDSTNVVANLNADLLDGFTSASFWKIGGNNGTTAGTHYLGTSDNEPLEIKVNGLRAMRIEDAGDGPDVGADPDGAPNILLGSPANSIGVGVVGGTISGGGATNFQGVALSNTVLASMTAIGGGGLNSISNSANYSTIGGGFNGRIGLGSDQAVIAGGANNFISTNSSSASVGGGNNNMVLANSDYATIPGGRDNSATNYALAAGRQAKAVHSGTFVWADSIGANFTSTAANQFLIRAGGGVGIGTASPTALLSVNGTANNATGSWGVFSDRRLKQDIAPLPAGSLDRLLQLEGVTYQYNREDLREGYRGPHRGWIAQDVEKVFPDWVSEAPDGMKMVTPVGFNALAVEALRELRAEKDAEITELKQRLDALEKLLKRLGVAQNGGGQ